MTLPVVFTANGPSGYNLTKSLRFRQSAGGNLSKTFASAGNQKTWTLSFWTKRGKLSYSNDLMGCYSASNDSGNFEARFSTGDQFQVVLWNYSSTTNAIFRDPAAWYHVVLVIDTTQAGTSSGSKVKVYVNGVLQSWSSDGISANISQNTNLAWNGTAAQYFCRWYASDGGGYYYDGEFAELNFIDGQALTPSSFGSTNALTGVWQPAKYTGSYGTNGFYLPFTDVATTSGSNAGLGKDFSGNGNYWTTNNISVTTGSTYDSMTDVPTLTSATTANYATWNPNYKDAVATTTSTSNANLTTNGQFAYSTIGVTTGKFYFEFTIGSANNQFVGVCASPYAAANLRTYNKDGTYYTGSGWISYGATYTTNDVIGVAFDMTNQTIEFFKNNTSQGQKTSIGLSSQTIFPMVYVESSGGITANFGQQGFTYTPPTGFVALNTYNLPTSTIVKGNTVMDATLYTGNGSAGRVITMSNMTNVGLAWVKIRSGSDDHRLANTVTGGNRHLKSNATDAESTGTNIIQAFSSNTFTIGSDTGVNANGSTYVGWVWANDGTSGSSNTAGSITSTVSVNATAGFSVVTYTGTGSVATIGHGLGVAPKMIIFKVRSNGTYGWYVYNSVIGATNHLVLNTTAASSSSSFLFNDTEPTSSVMTVGTSAGTNQSGQTYVAYCWTPIAGFSAMGSYTGNGSSDGAFVYTGFRPKFVLMKATSGSNNWIIYDTVRNTYNLTNYSLVPDSSAAENGVSTTTENTLDILSNGFKLRTGNALTNGSSVPYIYMAFAENPFKNALAR